MRIEESFDEMEDSYEEGGSEDILLDNTLVNVPSELFTNTRLFFNFFSVETFLTMDQAIKEKINDMLPNFPEDDDDQKLKSLEMLFSGQNIAFGNPLIDFRDKVLNGKYYPEYVLMQRAVRNAKRRDKEIQIEEYQFRLMHDLLVSRKSLLEATSGNSVSVPLAVQKLEKQTITLGSSVQHRSSRRYIEEVHDVKNQVEEYDVSSDDEYCALQCQDHGKQLKISDEVPLNQIKEENKLFQDNKKILLKQETHVSYFHLICDLFECSPNKRMILSEVETAVSNWQESPIAGLNSWYSLAEHHLGWVKLLESALFYLSSEQVGHKVPFVTIEGNGREYKWQGDGRESELAFLFESWWQTKDQIQENLISVHHNQTGTNQFSSELDSSFLQERLEFQRQETKRYSDPSRSFRWVMQDYSVCVGPVKSVGVKMKSHPLLLPNRPAYVTLLSLVRDAVSRLPNGEGSRMDILHLIKHSQFLVPDPDPKSLSSSLSSALDRLQNEPEPCVAFDSIKKVWIYCHRDLSMEDLELLAQQSTNKSKRIKVK